MSKFALVPSVKTFKANEFKKLEKELDDIEAVTSIDPVSSAADVTLAKGTFVTHSGYTLTTTALSQLCRNLCPGLIKVVADLAGINMLMPDRMLKPDLALSIFNHTINARFDQLADKNLVRNLKLKRIDGIIGAGYRTLSNKSFLEITSDALTSLPFKFYEATLIGRTMIVCYLHQDPFLSKPEPYFSGYYFTNSEVGDCSVKIASMLVRYNTNDRAIRPFERGRMVHVGKSFVARVRKSVFTAVTKDWPNPEWMKKKITVLPKLTLGFKNLDEKQGLERIDELVAKLVRKGMGHQLAERAVYSALYQGRETEMPKSNELSIRKELWKSRTAYDLFVSLMRDAKNRTLSVRECMERAAFEILNNRSMFI